MKPRRSLSFHLRWVLAASLAALAIYSGGACGNDACENAFTHMQDCLMDRVDAGGTETATSTVDCSGATQCEAICVLDADCASIAIHASAVTETPKKDPLGACFARCAAGTTR
jgi:hypothetical protein